MTDLNDLDIALGAMLSNLAPAARKKVLRELSKELRNRQKKRITAQKNPDGSAYAPRRAHPERGKMFKRLKLARNLKFRATDSEATVEFRGPHIRTELIHQYGLEGRISPENHHMVKYPARRLLGFSREDEAWLRETLLNWLART
ncbi:phage virion morphogenesis protein [Salmonella enterica]|uniref:Phage virion morphogenesis protein n=2 Tax=Salmonella enterica TaxID=28901 RepID=A0A6Y1QS68_SALDZ|nr:phage virion morphogenesis protein [Salmonella enterica]EBG0729241.1 phage virion morphogenesis protein [Salmonella enterica subsp. enterica serovar Kambole]EBH8037234.1 phage virion morphogenesis protein [Salmonella bongori]EBH8149460.1 phage virion morphogenesis protein [Salmonella enterica subsp. enterica serovar Bareilly str. CFSAN000189]EBS4322865.1 phage virion morphogenesis protein [Salmonella enterica subsp. enterica serovar Richmond]ECH8734004.1 phage virion morphogenesis protein [